MKKLLLISFISVPAVFSRLAAQQLPPVARALYDAAYKQDKKRVQYAADNGAAIRATPDGNSFYIQWFPADSIPAKTPIIVTLHGSDGFAFNEFFLWHKQAILHGCGIIALQWYKGPASARPNDYFDDQTIYSYIDSALTSINYPPGKAFLHGFSRGAARSYAIVFNDSHGGKNYFCTTLANSGGADAGYPLYAAINEGRYGKNVFAGKHWTLFCGGMDPNPTRSGCEGMNNTKTWLEKQGAIVDLFIQDAGLGHGGFHHTPAYMDTALNNYLHCFGIDQSR